jgi:hypothetical protein
MENGVSIKDIVLATKAKAAEAGAKNDTIGEIYSILA